MGKQTLDKKGQPIIVPDKDCPHGIHGDDRGNNACEECSENSATSSYLLGIAVGFEQAAAGLLEAAGKLFSAGKDDEAELYRDIAKKLAETAEARREDQKKHDVEYPKRG